jgi:hypothetical protein
LVAVATGGIDAALVVTGDEVAGVTGWRFCAAAWDWIAEAATGEFMLGDAVVLSGTRIGVEAVTGFDEAGTSLVGLPALLESAGL